MDWGSKKFSLGKWVGMRLENWQQQTQGPQCSLANQESYLRRQLQQEQSQGPCCQGGFFLPKLTLGAFQGLSKPLQAGIPGYILSSSCLFLSWVFQKLFMCISVRNHGEQEQKLKQAFPSWQAFLCCCRLIISCQITNYPPELLQRNETAFLKANNKYSPQNG